MPVEPGQRLSHYRLVQKIGEGGMGIVYQAQDESLNRTVALKVLPPGALHDKESRKRFRKEALSLSRLNHPNIETIHHFESDRGIDFLVMEYVPGQGLDEKLAAGPLPEEEIVRLGGQLAAGLAAAHAEGVVHRDLKPSNLRLTGDGRLKILDFGLAKWLQDPDRFGTTLSGTEGGAGTLPYMAPEQLRKEGIDPRSDIYALGAVLYEMATGRRPFPQTSPPRLIEAILNEAPVPPSALNPRISPELERGILKALDKNPELRYQAAREVEVDLERLGSRASTGGSPHARTRAGRRGMILVGVALMAGLGLVAGLNSGRVRESFLRRLGHGRISSLAVLPLANLSGDPGQEYFAEGMTDELITSLAQIRSLRVISRTSVMQYKGTQKKLPVIAKELGVQAVLEGSVRRMGEECG